MHSILIVIGTRPEAIKMAPVVLALQARDSVRVVLCVSGQHRDMVGPALEFFGLTPDIDLHVMTPGQELTDLFARVLTGVRDTIRSIKPDAMLVHGDTTTCLAAAMAAFYEHIPCGHVEAGLRTGNLNAPWPEEMNRRFVDPLCKWCFAPTILASDNLKKEGVSEGHIFITGNTGIDALLEAVRRVNEHPPVIEGLSESDMAGRKILLVTGHRRENFGAGLEQICAALREIADRNPDVLIVYPVHLNPHVAEPVTRLLGGHERIRLLPPLDYAPFVWLMQRSIVILTDSGGIQEEGPSLGKPVLVMRDTTERPEAVTAGTVKLVGTNRAVIIAEVERVLKDSAARASMTGVGNPYGDGTAAEQIAGIMVRDLSS
ncbi:MAG: UDP-N-acetylglucosamine 2-epimerase (non-hydrolyzing) [Planctomycetota bacterium]